MTLIGTQQVGLVSTRVSYEEQRFMDCVLCHLTLVRCTIKNPKPQTPLRAPLVVPVGKGQNWNKVGVDISRWIDGRCLNFSA